jgi:hypothetical protein
MGDPPAPDRKTGHYQSPDERWGIFEKTELTRPYPQR